MLYQQWVKANKKSLFIDPNDDIISEYSNIANLVVSQYEPQHVQTFLNRADPWVIAFEKI